MVTSSIFHTVSVDTSQKAEIFVEALEAAERAEQDVGCRRKSVKVKYVSDPAEVKAMFRRRRAWCIS